jgi:DNA-binding CsgD family transcriptional regulator
MQVPDRVADADHRSAAILAAGRPASRAERARVAKAMFMRLGTGARRDEILPIARDLLRDGELARDDGPSQSRARVHLSACLSLCDDYAAADEAFDLMLADARRRGSVSTFAAASMMRARQRVWTGPVADAVHDGRTCVDVWRGGMKMYVHGGAHNLVTALLEQDEPDAAEEALALGRNDPAPLGHFAAYRATGLARLAMYRGEYDEALEESLSAGRHLLELLMVNPVVTPWRSDAGLAAQRLGKHELARELIGEELALAEDFGAARAIGVATRALGLLERGEDAVDRLRAAAGLFAGCGARVDEARALIDLGAAIRRAGRPTEARATLRDALALADATGAVALARRAREELRVAGGKAPAPADARGASLTPSEHRVAELAAAGQTNRQIADALFVTVKSVEWHLGNVYRKLDIRGRVQLAAALSA